MVLRSVSRDSTVMTLKDDLDVLRRERRAALTPEERAIFWDALERLRMLQIAEDGPRPGELFPDFELLDTAGRTVRSDALVGERPLVLVFFRGGWCEYCDLTMRAVEAVRPAIEALGAGLVGVLPEKPDFLAVTCAAKGIAFPCFSDPDGRLARLCGLEFDLTPAQIAFYAEHRALDLVDRNAGSGWRLPIPAAFLLDPEGVVAYAFVDPDYTQRAEPSDLVEAVRRLRRADASRSGDPNAAGL
jgi:peroxiredoxin